MNRIAILICLLASFVGADIAGAQTTTISRLQIVHPNLSYPGGSGLHTLLQNIYTRIGDNMDSRYFEVTALANGANTDLTHNFKTAFAALAVDLYLWNSGTGELTYISDATSPSRSQFALAGTPSFLTTKLRVTNNSGSSRDLVVIVRQQPTLLDQLYDVGISSPSTGQVLTYSAGTWINSPPSGGGGGTGANWYAPAGTGPVAAEENGQSVYLYPDAVDQELHLWLSVPDSYIAGNQITMSIAAYSPSTSNAYVMASTSYLVRAGTDAASTSANSQAGTATFTNGSPANLLTRGTLSITSGSGQINSIAVAAGDMIHIVLSRNYSSGSDTDTADVRFVPGSTSVRLSP